MTSLIRGRGNGGAVSWLRATQGPPDELGPGFDVVILAGQSNMDGAGTIDPMIDVGDPRIWTYPAQGADTGTLVVAADPLQHPSPSPAAYVGPGMAFAREWITYVAANRKVLLVPCAVGGTGLAPAGQTWSVGGTRFNFAVSHTLAALEAAEDDEPGQTHRLIGVLWAQGENDATRSVSQATYAASFDSMMTAYRAAFDTPDLPVVVGSMVPEWRTAPNGTSVAIHAAHADTPNRDDRAVFVDGPGTGYGQDTGLIHWNAAAQRLIGTAMAEALFALPEAEPVSPDDPGDPIRSWTLDETTSNFADSSTANDPLLVTAIGSASRTGNGVDFNSDATTHITNAASWLNGLTAFSFAFTVETTVSSGTHALVCRDDAGRSSGHQDRMFYTAIIGSTGKMTFQVVVPATADVSGNVSTTSMLTDGAPHRVVVTVGGGRIRIYVDAALDASGSYGGGALTTSGAQPLVLGKIDVGTGGFTWTWHLDGLLRDVTFWDTELTAGQAVNA